LLLNTFEFLMTDPECLKKRYLKAFSRVTKIFTESWYASLNPLNSCSIRRIKLLKNVNMIEVERVARFFAAIEDNAYLIVVTCDDLCFHET
jgi:hypothetical protein